MYEAAIRRPIHYGEATLTAEAPRFRSVLRPAPWHRSGWFELGQFLVLSALLAWITLRGAQSMNYAWQWEKVPRYVYRYIGGEFVPGPLLKGLGVTLNISWVAMLLTVAIGFLVAMLRLSPSIVGRAIASFYIEIIRNTPILIQILIIYFILGRIFGIPRFSAGVLCLALYEGAFAAEIIRAGIIAVHRGQGEAARSLGLSGSDIYRDIILPQALPLMLPPLAGVMVNLIKHSAIVSVIAVFDLTTEARTVVADTFLAFEIWLVTACLYLSITIPLSLAVAAVERHYRLTNKAK
jgi:polar amino acid transport system permease protein